MKHLERAYVGNNFIPWYLVVLLIIFVVQGVFTICSFVIEDFLDTSDKNIILLLLLLPFALSIPVFDLLIRSFHKRNIIEVINGRKQIRYSKIYWGFLVWSVLMLLAAVLNYLLYPEDFSFQFEVTKFIPLIFISLIFIPLQATFEEIIFRGYIMQGVARLIGYRWVALFVSSFVFTIMHMENPEITKYGQIMFFNYLAMALIWGVITILDDGIEIPIGMHIANNIFISVFTTERGAAFETYAVFEVAESDPYMGLLSIMISGLLVIIFFYKKYKWDFSILNKKVEKPIDNTTSVS